MENEKHKEDVINLLEQLTQQIRDDKMIPIHIDIHREEREIGSIDGFKQFELTGKCIINFVFRDVRGANLCDK